MKSARSVCESRSTTSAFPGPISQLDRRRYRVPNFSLDGAYLVENLRQDFPGEQKMVCFRYIGWQTIDRIAPSAKVNVMFVKQGVKGWSGCLVVLDKVRKWDVVQLVGALKNLAERVD